MKPEFVPVSVKIEPDAEYTSLQEAIMVSVERLTKPGSWVTRIEGNQIMYLTYDDVERWRTALPAAVVKRLTYRLGAKEVMTPFSFTLEMPRAALKRAPKAKKVEVIYFHKKAVYLGEES